MIVAQDPYLVFLDRKSPYNCPDAILQQLQSAKDACLEDPDFGLWNFNGRLMDLGDAHELLSWSFLFDGVYKLEVQVSASGLDLELPPDFEWEQVFVQGRVEATIRFPSGELLLAGLELPGPDALSFTSIPPGDYRVRVAVNDAAVNDHSFLESPGEYLSGDGPDWIIRLEGPFLGSDEGQDISAYGDSEFTDAYADDQDQMTHEQLTRKL
jgi:hypothetical protein